MSRSQFTILGLAILAMMFGTGCAGHYVPNHGGGKRWLWEQRALTRATQQSVASLNFDSLRNQSVRLVVRMIGHEGGGTSGQKPGILNLATSGRMGGSSGALVADVVGDVQSAQSADAQSFAYANASDTVWMQGCIEQKLGEYGVRICNSDDASCQGTLHVLVSTFGIDKWGSNFLVYRKERLDAAVSMTCMYVDNRTQEIRRMTPVPVTGEATYMERYMFGFLMQGPEFVESGK